VAVLLTFSKKVKQAYRNYGFESLFIIGQQGMGKTTYALLVLYEVYRDWDKVLEYTFFDLPSAIPVFEEAIRERKRIPVVLFDDAGIHLSKYLWFSAEGRGLIMWFNAFYNIIRSVVSAVIFTSPDLDTMVEIRKKSWWVGEPKKTPGDPVRNPVRAMVLYKKRIMVTGKVYVSKKAIDTYRLDLIPQDVRREYEEKRQGALEVTFRMLKEALQRLGPQGVHTPPYPVTQGQGLPGGE
jgi:hypothetical protein